MSTWLLALVVTVVGVLPLVLRRNPSQRLAHASTMGVISFLLLAWQFYAGVPSAVWPLFGAYGAMVMVLWIVAAFVDGLSEKRITSVALFPAAAILIFIVTGLLNGDRPRLFCPRLLYARGFLSRRGEYSLALLAAWGDNGMAEAAGSAS